MSWKIERDPYYGDIFRNSENGLEAVEAAGYFDDSTVEPYDILSSLDDMSTPINFIKNRLDLIGTNKSVILLTTGSFCPIHDGHIEMMEIAKRKMEEKGYVVLGGYFAPDHDEYIFSKVKDKPLKIYQRLKFIIEKIKQKNNQDWLDIDLWPGFFRKEAINFTEIIYRLQLYVKKHIGIEIPVVFVFGSDNYRFMNAFKLKGMGCMVTRPGNVYNSYDWDNNRHFIAEGYSTMSSTKHRSMYDDCTPEMPTKYILRQSDDPREEKILECLMDHLSGKEVQVLKVSDQLKTFDNTWGNKKVISLDSLTKSNFNIGISRLYDYMGYRQLGYTSRPNCKSLTEQIEIIDKNNSYILFDDDIHSGNTMNTTRRILELNCIKIVGIASYINSVNEEIIDVRDFLFDNDNSGLVIQVINGDSKRFPYIYPYVCPYLRSSIPNPFEFSDDIRKINENLTLY